MPIKFVLGGVTVERNKFKEFPSFLAARTQAVLDARATTVAAEIAAAYAALGGTGELAAGMVVRSQPRKTRARVVIANRVRWSAGYEFGTKSRRTKKGANRGFIPYDNDGRIFVPRVMAARVGLVPRIAALLRAEGLTVTGG